MRLFVVLSLLCMRMLFATDAMEAAKNLGVENRYDTAIAKATKENKMLIMVIVKKHCRWCEKLVDKTLSNRQVRDTLNDFVTLIVDKGADYPSDFNVSFFPSIFYIDPASGKSVYESMGYVGVKCFINDLHDAQKTRESLYEE